MDLLTQEEYVKDSRIACKYGRKCYQKNPTHHTKYKHPPKKRLGENAENRNKKAKIDDSNSNSSDSNNDHQTTSVDKPETISESSSEPTENQMNKVEHMETNENGTSETTETQGDTIEDDNKPEKMILKGFDKKEFIKSKFLVEMPDDFYKFWDFCKKLNSNNPMLALKEVDLTLAGPFDVLAGLFDNTVEQDEQKYLLHWRFYYDPPEFQTVLIGNSLGYHVGYFRDEPTKNPVFLAENYAEKNGSFSVIGDNIFAAVYIYLNDSLKTASPFKKMSIQRFITLIKKEAEKHNFDLSRKSPSIAQRDRKIIARSFNSLGMVVQYDKKSELGYRPLAMSNKELKVIFGKLTKANGSERDKLMSDLQPVLTFASIATDECDFATGLELGLDMLFYGIDHLNAVTNKYLANAYNLLNRIEFAQISKAHMENRKRGNKLSII